MICNCGFTGEAADFWRGRVCKACKRASDSAAHAAQAAKAKAAREALTYGVEIEVHGISERDGAALLAATLGGGPVFPIRNGFATEVDGRKWSAVHDGSVSHGCEVVTPVLRANNPADMDALQRVVRALRAKGCHVSSQTGIHVHVGVEAMGGIAAAARLCRIGTVVEPALTVALGILPARTRFCQPIDATLANRLRGVATVDEMATAWYGDANNAYARRDHYHHSRYRGINLHSYFWHATAEFRWFNSTLHAGKVRSHVELCLALAAKAASTTVVPTKAFSADRAGMVAMMGWLKLRGENVRGHLLAAWSGAVGEEAAA